MPEPTISPYPLHPPACQEYDPRTPEVAQRLAELMADRLPTATVEHIGSTSVPGCAGKGVVDVIVVYPPGQLEAAKAALAALGFQHQTHGHIHPETRPMRVGALIYKGTQFRLHVHVLAAGSREVSQMRAFRDWLRADSRRVAAYVARKREILASGITDPADYTRMKSQFVEEALKDGDGAKRRTAASTLSG